MNKILSTATLATTLLLSGTAYAESDFPLMGSMASASHLLAPASYGKSPVEFSTPRPAGEDAALSCALGAETVKQAIESANARLREAFRSGDSATLASIFAENANVFVPSNVSLEGREDIVRYLQGQQKRGVGGPELHTEEVITIGDLAYEAGTYGFDAGATGSHLAGDSGRYFAIWKSQPDGSWRYQAGIWNSERAQAPSTSRTL